MNIKHKRKKKTESDLNRWRQSFFSLVTVEIMGLRFCGFLTKIRNSEYAHIGSSAWCIAWPRRRRCGHTYQTKTILVKLFAVHLPSGISRFLWGREMTAIVCSLRGTVRLLPVAMSYLIHCNYIWFQHTQFFNYFGSLLFIRFKSYI